jgi:hypothetical protein
MELPSLFYVLVSLPASFLLAAPRVSIPKSRFGVRRLYP